MSDGTSWAGPSMSEAYLNENYGYQIVATAVVMLVLQLAAVGVRFAARPILKTRIGLDDYLIIPALVRHCPALG